jgi:hypothetical protein
MIRSTRPYKLHITASNCPFTAKTSGSRISTAGCPVWPRTRSDFGSLHGAVALVEREHNRKSVWIDWPAQIESSRFGKTRRTAALRQRLPSRDAKSPKGFSPAFKSEMFATQDRRLGRQLSSGMKLAKENSILWGFPLVSTAANRYPETL